MLSTFFQNFFKKSNSSENSKNFTKRGPYNANTYSVKIKKKYLIAYSLF